MFATHRHRPWWNQFSHLQKEVDRLLDRWNGSCREKAEQGATTFPPINMWEDADSIHVEAELPGFGLEELEIFVTGQNQLSLKGERKQQAPDKSVQHRQERFLGSFQRELTLPIAVDASKVDARLENGVLRIRLPKQEQAKPQKIVVKG